MQPLIPENCIVSCPGLKECSMMGHLRDQITGMCIDPNSAVGRLLLMRKRAAALEKSEKELKGGYKNGIKAGATVVDLSSIIEKTQMKLDVLREEELEQKIKDKIIEVRKEQEEEEEEKEEEEEEKNEPSVTLKKFVGNQTSTLPKEEKEDIQDLLKSETFEAMDAEQKEEDNEKYKKIVDTLKLKMLEAVKIVESKEKDIAELQRKATIQYNEAQQLERLKNELTKKLEFEEVNLKVVEERLTKEKVKAAAESDGNVETPSFKKLKTMFEIINAEAQRLSKSLKVAQDQYDEAAAENLQLITQLQEMADELKILKIKYVTSKELYKEAVEKYKKSFSDAIEGGGDDLVVTGKSLLLKGGKDKNLQQIYHQEELAAKFLLSNGILPKSTTKEKFNHIMANIRKRLHEEEDVVFDVKNFI